MLEKFPTGIVACVSDSYNIWDACEKVWGGELKELVQGRKGTLVVRPDSGDPPTVVVKVCQQNRTFIQKTNLCLSKLNGFQAGFLFIF